MQKNILGKFQTREFTYWKGLTRESHLASFMQKNCPQRMSDLMVQLLAFKHGKTLDSLLSSFPTKEFESDNEYFWDVIGSADRNIPLVEARDEDGVVVTAGHGNVGAGTAPFYLVFGEDWSKWAA